MLLNAQSATEFIQDELLRRTRANRNYSLRAYARDLGLSPGELSEIINGKRKVSLKNAAKISEILGLSPDEERYLYQLVNSKTTPARSPQSQSEVLTLDLFRVVSDWYCFAILNLADTREFSWDPSSISKRLGISVIEVRDALKRLERVGLIEASKSEYKIAKDFVFTSEGVPSEAVRQYHKSMLEKAKTAIDSQPVNERYFSGVGLSIDASKLKSLHRDLGLFLQQMAKKYGDQKGSEVYQLELSFFRITEKQ